MVLVDDIHLADAHSQQLISYLARRLDNTGIVMVVSVPSPAPSIDHDLDELLHNPISSRVAVTPVGAFRPSNNWPTLMGVHGLDATAVTALNRLHRRVVGIRGPDSAGPTRWPMADRPAGLPLPERIVADVGWLRCARVRTQMSGS